MSDGEDVAVKKNVVQYGSLEGKVGASGAESIQKGVEAGNINISDPSKWFRLIASYKVYSATL